MLTILITFYNCNKIMTYKPKNVQTLIIKNAFFFLFVANASCTIETNRKLNPVYKCFTINQIYKKIFTFFQSFKLINMQFVH